MIRFLLIIILSIVSAEAKAQILPSCAKVKYLENSPGPNWGDMGGLCPFKSKDTCSDLKYRVNVENKCNDTIKLYINAGRQSQSRILQAGKSDEFSCLQQEDKCISISVKGSLQVSDSVKKELKQQNGDGQNISRVTTNQPRAADASKQVLLEKQLISVLPALKKSCAGGGYKGCSNNMACQNYVDAKAKYCEAIIAYRPGGDVNELASLSKSMETRQQEWDNKIDKNVAKSRNMLKIKADGDRQSAQGRSYSGNRTMDPCVVYATGYRFPGCKSSH